MNRVITLSGQAQNSVTKTFSILSHLRFLTPNSLALIVLIISAVFCQTSSLRAQESEQNSVRSLQASKVALGEVKIDGHLNEKPWQQAAIATGFTQRDPKDGSPATEKTEVRVLYSDDAIYVGVRAFDSEPRLISREIARRDEGAQSDEIVIYFDSYHDRRNCFAFAVTPGGSYSDATFFGDSDDNADLSWDPVWQVATSIDSLGWTAEFRIPFSQLRFEKDRKKWGFQVSRDIYHKAEEVYWSPYSKEASGFVSLFGVLEGLDDLEAPTRLEIRPYTVASSRKRPEGTGIFYAPSKVTDMNVGLDVKYGLTSNLTVDLTINPDFGQVEADPSEINLTAFESFFSEKRRFFVEGSGLFNKSSPAGRIFYSRRIGRRPRGFASPPSGGTIEIPEASTIISAAKITGKTAGGMGIGILSALNASESGTLRDSLGNNVGSEKIGPFTHYFAGRIEQEFNQGNNLVGLSVTAVNRSLNDNLSFMPSAAYVGLADGVHRWQKNKYAFRWSLAASNVRGSREAITNVQVSPFRYYQRPDADHLELDTTRTSLSGSSFSVRGAKESGNWQYYGYYERTSPGFEINDMGFQINADMQFAETFLKYIQSKPRGILRSFRYDLGLNTGLTTAGENRWTWFRPVHFVATFHNNWTVDFNPMAIQWQPLSIGKLRGGPALRNDMWHNSFIGINSDTRKRVSFDLGANIGGNFDNRESFYNISPTVKIRPSAILNASLGLSYSWVRDPIQWVGKFDALGSTRYVLAEIEYQQLRMTMRVNWTLKPTLSVQLYAQPFVAAGSYSRFKEVVDPRAKEFYDRFRNLDDELNCVNGNCDVDLDNDGSADFSFVQPDFNFGEIRSTLVIRWEYKPGSVLFFAWQHGRSNSRSDGSFNWRDDLSDVLSTAADNTLLVKVNYWISI